MPSLNREVDYNSPLHKKIVRAVMGRVDFSCEKMRDRHEKWIESEEKYVAYMKVSEKDRLKKANRAAGNPEYTTIEIPYSYAILMAAHTYWTSVFLARTPVHQFTARHGEPMMHVQAMEAMIDYQIRVGRHLIPYYIWLLDTGKYGLGVMGCYWEEEIGQVSSIVEEQETYLGSPIEGRFRKKRVTKRVRKYQGNKVYNIRPYDYRPDPRVPLGNPSAGEFAGRRVDLNWNELVKGEAAGTYFNINVLRDKKISGMKTRREWGSDQIELPSEETLSNYLDMNHMDQIEGEEMVIEIIPSKWGLGSSDYPEKWLFVVANPGTDPVLIRCHPQSSYHDQFPYMVLEYEMDGYQLFKRSMMEIMQPLNEVMTWLVNTHFYNVRRIINDNIIVDPSRVVMKDLTDGGPGKIIRLKPGHYGEDVRTMVSQLQVVDVTQAHMGDTERVERLIQRVIGVNDNIMGMLNPGGRKTATEVRSSTTFGINRLKTNSEYFSASGWTDLSMQMVSNTQQYYDGEMKLKLAGDLLDPMAEAQIITPDMISGFYDYVPVDGTLPVDRFAQANLWRELMGGMMDLGLHQQFDMGKIFIHVAQLAGAKNINQFRLQLSPDQVLASQMQEGNVVPIGGQGGRRSRAGSIATEGDAGRVEEPGQVSGMGTTG